MLAAWQGRAFPAVQFALVLRALNNYGLPHSLRMTIGTEEANRLVVDGLRDFMAGK